MRLLRAVFLASLVFILASHGLAGDFPLEQWKAWRRHSADRFPRRTWRQYATPEEAGWSSEKLEQARAYFDALDSAAAMVVYGGAVLAAWGETDRRFPCHSMRKSLLNALYGIHVTEGNLDLDKTLADLKIDDDPPLTSAEREAQVIDLLRSRSGVYHPAAYETQQMGESRPARGSHRPGESFWYNNWDFNALSTILEQESGTRVFEEFERRFANPLAMEDFRLRDGYYHLEIEHSRHPAYPFCMSGRDLARFGLLFLQKGRWKGRQILTRRWIRESTASYFKEGDTTPNPQYAYGYLWWPVVGGPFKDLGMYSARGYGGHAIDVVPAANLVLVHRVNTYWDVCSFLNLEEHRVKDEERFQLLAMILDARVAPPPPDPKLTRLRTSRKPIDTVELEPGTLDRYVGSYDFDAFQLRVTRSDDGLLIGHPGKGDFRLLPLSPMEFSIEDVELPVTFKLDESADPTEMTIKTGPDKTLIGRAT